MMEPQHGAAVDWASNERILDMLVCSKVAPSRKSPEVHRVVPAARTEAPPVASALAACQRRGSAAPARSLRSLVRSASASGSAARAASLPAPHQDVGAAGHPSCGARASQRGGTTRLNGHKTMLQ